ncbi:MAG TPA: MFS transporter [Alphaproteobacteria bacterium]|jgi:PAT family beta-lactamase induction signal transducer AmpG
MSASAAAPKRKSWRESLAAYRDRRVLAMLFLGFSAGLPYALIFPTLSRWLSEAGVSVASIGLFSLAGLAYGFKFVWAPLADRMPLPFLTRALGRRRSWILLGQAGITAGLVGMALTDPKAALWTMALLAVIVAFSGATQDIAIDAWRIEIAPEEVQGALAGSYQLGYRIALFAAGAGVFLMVDALQPTGGTLAQINHGWMIGYLAMAAAMLLGIATTLLVREPEATLDAGTAAREMHLAAALHAERSFLGRASAWLVNAVVNPFVDFFARNGWIGLAILAFIGCYWLSDRVWGVMAQPFYNHVGFDKTEVALVSKSYGIFMSIAGALLGGVLIARMGTMRLLLLSAALTAGTNLLFALLALNGKSLPLLIAVISGENLAGGMAGTALIAYLSGLTNTAYTATQYALFSSFMALPGKLLAGVSGFVVEGVGYPLFFVYTAAMGVPAILLILVLMTHARREKAREPIPAVAAAPSARSWTHNA